MLPMSCPIGVIVLWGRCPVGVIVLGSSWQRGSCPRKVIVLRGNYPWKIDECTHHSIRMSERT